MPPGGKARKKAKGDVSDVTSEIFTDDMVVDNPTSRRIRHTESESSVDGCTSAGKQKKYKSAEAAATAAAVPMAVTAAATDDSDGAAMGAAKRESRSRRKMAGDQGVTLAEVRKVTDSLHDVVFGISAPLDAIKKIIDHGARYEDLVMKLLLEREHLKGQLETLRSNMKEAPVVGTPVATSATTKAASAVKIPKPVETWSVVVRGKNGGASSKEVVEKVVGEVGPTLGVRVHDIRPMKSGGAVLRTPSVAEREKIAANRKFEEVGLEVSVKDKLGPKIVVQRVHTAISPDEFMEELYSMNLGEMMTKTAYKKSVRLVSAPWKQEEGMVNVTLECTEKVADHLRATGVYIKWFRFIVRMTDAVMACHRCYGFDHRVKDCRMRAEICRLCGQSGHLASQCVNPVHCRNCALRRCPADHPMMSMQCPTYAAMVARANARH